MRRQDSQAVEQQEARQRATSSRMAGRPAPNLQKAEDRVYGFVLCIPLHGNFLFFLMATPMAYGRPGIESEQQLRPVPQLRQHQILLSAVLGLGPKRVSLQSPEPLHSDS